MPLAVCATPIGNLEDVTLRVLAELAAADVVLCEDTRHTRKLLARHGVAARLVSYHEHNEAARTSELLPRLVAGERVALVSDAGLPGVSDPGVRLVSAAVEAGVPVTVLPGASAVTAALVIAGFDLDRYQFVGFLPRRAGDRTALLKELARWPFAIVAFESPRRLRTTLVAIAAVMPRRRLAVARELTKRYEEVLRGTATELAARVVEAPKGEITLVFGPLAPGEMAPAAGAADAAIEAVGELVAAGLPRRKAAAVVASLTGVSRNELYALTLERRR